MQRPQIFEGRNPLKTKSIWERISYGWVAQLMETVHTDFFTKPTTDAEGKTEENKKEEDDEPKKKIEPEEPLEFPTSKTVFDEVIRLITCVMANAEDGKNKNLKTKHLAVF